MEEPETTGTANNNRSTSTPEENTVHRTVPSKEEILDQLKYIGPILESRIEYNNQVLPFLREIRKLESQRSKIKNESSTATYSQSKTIGAQMRIRSNLLKSLQHQIDEKLSSLREITDFEFNASELDCFIYFKETDQKINMCAREIYKLIQKSSTDEEFFNEINILFAYLSTAIHLNRPFAMTLEELTLMQQNGGTITKEGETLRIAGSAKSVKRSEKEHRDKPYHVMILQLLSPYSSENAKIFHSFFARNNKGAIELSWTKYQDKIGQLFRNTLGPIHKIQDQGNEELRRTTYMKTTMLLENLGIESNRAKVFFDRFFKKMTEFFKEGRLGQVIDTYAYFANTYTDLHGDFLRLKLFCRDMSAALSNHFQIYSEDLIDIGCVHMPNFLSVCQKILAQPDFTPIIYTGTDKALTIEEKLAKLSLYEDGLEQATANEEETSEKPSSSGKKKAKKKKKAFPAACDTERQDSDEDADKRSVTEEHSNVEDIPSEYNDAISSENVSHDDTTHAEAQKEIKTNHPDIVASQFDQGAKAKKSTTKSALATLRLPLPESKKTIMDTASIMEPWITSLLTAHEYDFKKTIRSVYWGLSDMGLNPSFITRNEKFVLGFISPLTTQPFAITEDIPHGSQLRKGQAAGWIKKIKRSLKEHNIIPAGY